MSENPTSEAVVETTQETPANEASVEANPTASVAVEPIADKKRKKPTRTMDISSIHIIGDGGIGSNLSLPLLKFLTYWLPTHRNRFEYGVSLNIFDGDRVEQTNLVRQHFLPIDINRPKSEITARHLQSMIRHLNVTDIGVQGINEYLKKETIGNFIGDNCVIFLAVDNHKTRVMVENFMSSRKNILVINGGNELTDGDIQVMWKILGRWQTPKITTLHPEMKTARDKYPDEQSCEEAAVSEPQLMLANSACAQHMLEAFYSFLEHDDVIWRERFFDLKTGAVRTVPNE